MNRLRMRKRALAFLSFSELSLHRRDFGGGRLGRAPRRRAALEVELLLRVGGLRPRRPPGSLRRELPALVAGEGRLLRRKRGREALPSAPRLPWLRRYLARPAR